MREKRRTHSLKKRLSTPVPFLASVTPPALWQPLHQSFYKSKCFIYWVLYFFCSLKSFSAIHPPQQISSCSSFPGFVSVWVPFLRMERDCQFLPAAFVVHGYWGTWIAHWLSLPFGFAHKVDAVYIMQRKMRLGRGEQEATFPLTNCSQGNHCFCCIAQEHIVFLKYIQC